MTGKPETAHSASSEAESSEAELSTVMRTSEQIALELEALKGDFAARSADQAAEIEVRKAAFFEGQKAVEALKLEMRDTVQANKLLKKQNLDLQYHLNAWGIPVTAGSEFENDLLERARMGQNRFFPAVAPLKAGQDPAPIVLRGDLGFFHLASLLSFLEHNNLCGVLTILENNIVSKLYLTDGTLRLAGWNDRESVFSLPSVLVKLGLLNEEEAESYRNEKLYDLEVAVRLLYEGRLDRQTVQSTLMHYTQRIITQLFHVREGSFFLQQGSISFEEGLQFSLSITDLLLRTAADVDRKLKAPE